MRQQASCAVIADLERALAPSDEARRDLAMLDAKRRAPRVGIVFAVVRVDRASQLVHISVADVLDTAEEAAAQVELLSALHPEADFAVRETEFFGRTA